MPSRDTTPSASARALDLDDDVARIALAPVGRDGRDGPAERADVELALERVGQRRALELEHATWPFEPVDVRELGVARELDDARDPSPAWWS